MSLTAIQTHNWPVLKLFYLKIGLCENGSDDSNISWFSGYEAVFTLESDSDPHNKPTPQVIDLIISKPEDFECLLLREGIAFEKAVLDDKIYVRIFDPDGNILRFFISESQSKPSPQPLMESAK
jgi:hypothetical protein